MSTRRELLALTSGAAVAATIPATAARASSSHHGWAGTWAAAPTTVPPGPPTVLEDQTVRHVVHVSAGGDQLRIRLTNEFGAEPLIVGEVRVARRAGTGASTATVPGTDRRVTFGERGAAKIPAGAPLVSDPVRLHVPAGSELTVSIHLPRRTPVTTLAAFAYQDNVIAAGNVTAVRSVTPTAVVSQSLFLSGVSVLSRATTIVALGDSITNGADTIGNLNHRWPDLLAQRLRDARIDRGVVNVGVSGNRLLHDPNPAPGSPAEAYAAYFAQSALRRYDRDVNAQPGASDLIVLLGVNDLGHPGTDPLRLAAAYDSGDHLHPNDAGMAVLAAAVPLRLFQ